ncbi:MAG TPA: hypothetical protein VFU02_17470, partial [Polyangiaceae bacterium]|nr:hypothetical protein [Polyangiaceae bacterium]
MADMLEAARASWERLEAEQGRDFMVQWRRDLSQAAKAGAHQQAQRDTVASAVRFSTDIEPPRTTQLGGLTPPLPLTGTRPLGDELPYQTTTPVSGLDVPRRRSSPPVVVVPSLEAPSTVVTPLPRGPELYSSPRVALTAAQSATLALAEQVTRTASVGIVDPSAELESTPRSPNVGDRSGGLSVAPVSHSSMAAGSLPLRAAGIPGPWFGGVSARVVVALGASLGLVLGVVYSVAGPRSPASAARPSVSGARPEGPQVDPRTPARGARNGSAAVTPAAPAPTPAGLALPAPGNSAQGPSVQAPSAQTPSAQGPSAQGLTAHVPAPSGQEGVRVEAGALRAEIAPRAGSRATDERSRPEATRSELSSSPPSTSSKSNAGSAGTAVSKRTPASTKKPERESWLKPEMIYYPDDPMPAPAKPPAQRMPRSGLD